jgi:hypothetical protein
VPITTETANTLPNTRRRLPGVDGLPTSTGIALIVISFVGFGQPLGSATCLKGPDLSFRPDRTPNDSQRFAANAVSAGRFISLMARAKESLVHFAEADAATLDCPESVHTRSAAE